jgi:nitrogen-specific signal transduction histidine kinase
MPPASEELVFALCHEVGNLLAAIRLQAAPLDDEATARIPELAGRAGALVALVRPLLSPPPLAAVSLDPLELLEALRRGLDEAADARVRIELRSAVDLPEVAIDPDTLYQLLLADCYAALESLAVDQRVRVVAERSPDGVTFAVEAPGDRAPDAAAVKLAGRSLTRALAQAILAVRGGAVAVSASEAGTRIAFTVPRSSA